MSSRLVFFADFPTPRVKISLFKIGIKLMTHPFLWTESSVQNCVRLKLPKMSKMLISSIFHALISCYETAKMLKMSKMLIMLVKVGKTAGFVKTVTCIR